MSNTQKSIDLPLTPGFKCFFWIKIYKMGTQTKLFLDKMTLKQKSIAIEQACRDFRSYKRQIGARKYCSQKGNIELQNALYDISLKNNVRYEFLEMLLLNRP